MLHREGILGIFAYADDFIHALRTLESTQVKIESVFSPFQLPEIQQVLHKKRGSVTAYTLIGGITAGFAVTAVAVYAHLSFRFIVSGKPVLPWVPWLVVTFEGVILGGVIATVATWLLKSGLPKLHTAIGYNASFSKDRFGILLTCPPDKEKGIQDLLQQTGAEEVRRVTW